MRKGLTLVELLMVVAILITVTAAVIPMVAPAVEARRVREAARGVNAFLAKVRATAIENGRSAGVFFSPSVGAAGNDASETLFQVEVPPPYCGSSTSSTVRLTRSPAVGDPATLVRLNAVFSEPIPDKFVRQNDTIRIGYQGVAYTINSSDTPGTGDCLQGNNFEIFVVLADGVSSPWPAAPTQSEPLPYQIFRQPVQSSAQPYTLPPGAVVDIAFSGIGGDWFKNIAPSTLPATLTAGEAVGLMFSPTGIVERVYYANGTASFTPSLPLHFLIGKSENLPVTLGQENWRDLENLWVSVGNLTGQVATSEMADIGISAATDGDRIRNTRKFAYEAKGMGGK